jgi:GT2 family glycosyltransferase
MTLSIIILQHNTPKDVSQNLHKLSKANLPINTEIIIVNNGGNNANQKIKIPDTLDVKLYETPNHGFPAGNNFGYQQSNPNSEFYLFINPDIEVEKDTIETLIQHMRKNPKVGISSAKLIYPDGKIQDNYRKFPNPIDLIIKRIKPLRKTFTKRMSNYLMWNRNPNNTQAVDWVTGAFTLISNPCMRAIKKHNENYFLFMSDVELCLEAWKNNFEVHIVGSSTALHNDTRISNGGIKEVFTKKIVRIHIIDSIKFFLKHLKNPPSRKVPPQTSK